MNRFVKLFLVGAIVISTFGLCSKYVFNPSAPLIRELTQETDEHVLEVKFGSPSTYPDITYADAFENFFGSPNWKYFRGKTEDSDKYYDVVEFTGSCIYRDVDVNARIQFKISDDGKTFEASYLAFNDIPQNMLLLNSLIDKIFSEYQEQTRMAKKEIKPLG